MIVHINTTRTGFLKDALEIPDDFDAIGKEEILAMFEDIETIPQHMTKMRLFLLN